MKNGYLAVYEETNGAPAVYVDDERTGLRELVLLFVSRWRLLASAAACGCAAALLYGFLTPDKFSAKAVIMPPQQQQSSAMALLGQVGALALGAGGARDLGLKSPSDLYLGLLQSRTIADALVSRFELRGVYGSGSAEEVRDDLARHSSIRSGKDTLIHITVEDTDPRRAAAIANGYVEELYKQNGRMAFGESAQRRLFFERRLEQEKAALTQAEAALRATQEQTGVVEVNSQMQAVVQAMAGLRAQIVAKEVALERLRTAATPENPEVVGLQSELRTLRSELRSLEARDGARRNGDPLIPAANLPEAGLEYLRSLREFKYHETLFELLAKQYEAARIDEAKDAPVIQVVDRAVPPDRKSGPPRALFGLAGATLACLLACCFVFAQHQLTLR